MTKNTDVELELVVNMYSMIISHCHQCNGAINNGYEQLKRVIKISHIVYLSVVGQMSTCHTDYIEVDLYLTPGEGGIQHLHVSKRW